MPFYQFQCPSCKTIFNYFDPVPYHAQETPRDQALTAACTNCGTTSPRTAATALTLGSGKA